MHFRLIEAGSVPTIAPMTASDPERARNEHSGKWRSSDSAPDRVRVLRKGLRLSQPAMARVLGISQRKLSQLENAARAPRPETTRRLVEVERLHHKNAVTPYADRTLAGVVRSTWLRGRRVDITEQAEPFGRLLTRGGA